VSGDLSVGPSVFGAGSGGGCPGGEAEVDESFEAGLGGLEVDLLLQKPATDGFFTAPRDGVLPGSGSGRRESNPHSQLGRSSRFVRDSA